MRVFYVFGHVVDKGACVCCVCVCVCVCVYVSGCVQSRHRLEVIHSPVSAHVREECGLLGIAKYWGLLSFVIKIKCWSDE